MEPASLELPSDLSIAHVEEIKNLIVSQFDDNQTINITDHNISKIDTVGLQLLLAIINYLSLKNCVVNWHIQSSILIESIKCLGLENSAFNQFLTQE